MNFDSNKGEWYQDGMMKARERMQKEGGYMYIILNLATIFYCMDIQTVIIVLN